jgi:hypothetical protein
MSGDRTKPNVEPHHHIILPASLTKAPHAPGTGGGGM